MSTSRDPQAYLIAAGGLALCAGAITYCAVNWDDPPDWWPNRLQPWWNKKDTDKKDEKQTSNYKKQTDDNEAVVDDGNDEGSDIEVQKATKNLVKLKDLEIELTDQ